MNFEGCLWRFKSFYKNKLKKEKKKRIVPKIGEEKFETKPEGVKKNGGCSIRDSQNNFPYEKDSLKRNIEKQTKFKQQLNETKEKRLEEKKVLEEKNQEYINEIVNIDNPEAIPVIIK